MSSLRACLTAAAAAAGLVLAGLGSPAPAAAASQIGACYAYKAATLQQDSSTAPVVGCETSHTAETYFVGTLPERFGLPSESSQAARLFAGRPCTVRAMNSYLGTPNRVLPSRFQTVVLFPTDAEWTAGERTFRCDVVLQGGLLLKPFSGTAAALVAAHPSTQFDFCTPNEPNARQTSAYPCGKPKRNWIKVLDTELGGPGSRFPGTGTVERKTRNLCEKQGKSWDGKEKYPGWWAIWPTSVGWEEGRRSAQCFVPYAQYLKELSQRAPVPAPVPVPVPIPAPTPEPIPTTDPPPPAA